MKDWRGNEVDTSGSCFADGFKWAGCRCTAHLFPIFDGRGGRWVLMVEASYQSDERHLGDAHTDQQPKLIPYFWLLEVADGEAAHSFAMAILRERFGLQT